MTTESSNPVPETTEPMSTKERLKQLEEDLTNPQVDQPFAANQLEMYRLGLLDSQAETKSLRDAAKAAMHHLAELVDAWQRGAIKELDNKGGTRSNKNLEIFRALDKGFKAMPDQAEKEANPDE